MKIQNSHFSQLPEDIEIDRVSEIVKKIPSKIEVQDWLVSYLAELLDIEPDAIDVKVTFDRYGLDSSAAIAMTGDLADWLGSELDPTLIYDYPTIEALVTNLLEEKEDVKI
jgi:acyl carrier protein